MAAGCKLHLLLLEGLLITPEQGSSWVWQLHSLVVRVFVFLFLFLICVWFLFFVFVFVWQSAWHVRHVSNAEMLKYLMKMREK